MPEAKELVTLFINLPKAGPGGDVDMWVNVDNIDSVTSYTLNGVTQTVYWMGRMCHQTTLSVDEVLRRIDCGVTK